ncbi:uncharacterized protein HfgLR_12590 [Haloferax gibbonsii]|uniref:Uncharacterized protein n=2 Tax=Haloferax gibbonsii TaxID=35746 RepID=A0A871BIU9_HALGI|nr:uncharacterized protein HfgLR_12590 [Haloferax gibbonsii]
MNIQRIVGGIVFMAVVAGLVGGTTFYALESVEQPQPPADIQVAATQTDADSILISGPVLNVEPRTRLS